MLAPTINRIGSLWTPCTIIQKKLIHFTQQYGDSHSDIEKLSPYDVSMIFFISRQQ